ncbi:hypothetical protein ACS0TY_017804 [Phlomoides rotata]
MVFPSDNLQDEFFYGIMWPKSITSALITFLLTKKQLGEWVWNSSNGSVILETREYLNASFHTDYTTMDVFGRVKKLRAPYTLFNIMVSQSGVVWNREQNFVYATIQQWADWREYYPMSRVYMTQGEPLYDDLKDLFAPDNGPQDDPSDDDELIIIVDSDDEDVPLFQFPIMHALPALDEVDIHLPVLPDSRGFSDDEDHIPVMMIEESIGEIINLDPATSLVPNNDNSDSPSNDLPIPSASLAAIRDVIRAIPQFPLRDGFTTSDSEDD